LSRADSKKEKKNLNSKRQTFPEQEGTLPADSLAHELHAALGLSLMAYPAGIGFIKPV
jgi:hypothetical protein